MCGNPFEKDDWSEESLKETWKIISNLAKEKYGLTWYEPHFEVVNFEDMLHIYSGSLPITYDHWSFGQNYERMYQQYANDRMAVAYEVIFNTSPALCYLLEHNSPTMQGLTIAHAAIGHSAFFRNNEVFKEMTNAGTIMEHLKKTREFIKECEIKYGEEAVEQLLDVCHAWSMYAIDRMPKKEKTQKAKDQVKKKRLENKQKEYSKEVEMMKANQSLRSSVSSPKYLHEENILRFVAKWSPALKPWQREIISMFCDIQQYLYPQMQTKVMNEGFASFWHYTLMNDLSDMGILPSGGTLEFLHSHTSVLRQLDFDERGYHGLNPYKLGFEIFKDIKRICENPTEEDKQWFPELIGQNWVEAVKFAAYNFKDDSFILQYLSPKLIRDLKLFSFSDNEEDGEYKILDIHDDDGYRKIRKELSEQYTFSNRIPDLYIEGWDAKRTRKLYLAFNKRDNIDIAEETCEALLMLQDLWGFNIIVKVIGPDGSITKASDDGEIE